MGRKCAKQPIVTWLKTACTNGTIQKIKLYCADELFTMYNSFIAKAKNDNDNDKVKNDNDNADFYFKVRGFCRTLNRIISGFDFKYLKSKYSKDDGYTVYVYRCI